jgi:hypothetical protein
MNDPLRDLRRSDMTAEQFRQELRRVAPSSIAASRVLGVPPDQIRKWSLGEEPVPTFAAFLLLNFEPATGPSQIAHG